MMIPEKGFTECVKNLRNRNSRLEREGDYWSPEEKERLMEMFYEGIGLSEIAIRLQRTEPGSLPANREDGPLWTQGPSETA